MSTCDSCAQNWPEDRYNRTCSAPTTCFKCRSAGISLALQGGKSYWHDDTESNRSRQAIAEGKAAGFDPVPVHTAGNAISATSLRKTEATAKTAGAFGKQRSTPPVTPSLAKVG